MDVDVVELLGGDGSLNRRGMAVGAKADPTDPSCSPELFDDLHAAALPQHPVQVFHRVHAVK